MSIDCVFCTADLRARTFFEEYGWFAFLDANPMVPGHTIVARTSTGGCPDRIGVESLAGIDRMVPRIFAALRDVYGAYDVLVTSLRGTVRHVHFHLVPLTSEAEKAWRIESRWDKGHLHEFLGYREREASLANERERIERGWTVERQMAEHEAELQPEATKIRTILGTRLAR